MKSKKMRSMKLAKLMLSGVVAFGAMSNAEFIDDLGLKTSLEAMEKRNTNEYVHFDENVAIFIGVDKDKPTVLKFKDEPVIEAKNPFNKNYLGMSVKGNQLTITPKSASIEDSFTVLGQSGMTYVIELVSVSGEMSRDQVKNIRRGDAVVDPKDQEMNSERYFWDFARSMIYGKNPPGGGEAYWTHGDESEDITGILKMNRDVIEVKTVRKYVGANGLIGIVAHAINKTDHPVRILLPKINFRGFRAAHAYPKLVQPKGSTRRIYDRGEYIDVYTDTSVLYILMEENAEI
jgi:hypothetical protein